jgi:hypothetical protein
MAQRAAAAYRLRRRLLLAHGCRELPLQPGARLVGLLLRAQALRTAQQISGKIA